MRWPKRCVGVGVGVAVGGDALALCRAASHCSLFACTRHTAVCVWERERERKREEARETSVCVLYVWVCVCVRVFVCVCVYMWERHVTHLNEWCDRGSGGVAMWRGAVMSLTRCLQPLACVGFKIGVCTYLYVCMHTCIYVYVYTYKYK